MGSTISLMYLGVVSTGLAWLLRFRVLKTNGLITIDKKIYSIQGLSWLDHEWSSELLHPDAVGWDWVGINLIDGGSLMAFRIRKNDGSTIWSDFSMLDANGKKHPWLEQKNISDTTVTAKWSILKECLSPYSFANYPFSQKMSICEKALIFVPLIVISFLYLMSKYLNLILSHYGRVTGLKMFRKHLVKYLSILRLTALPFLSLWYVINIKGGDYEAVSYTHLTLPTTPYV